MYLFSEFILMNRFETLGLGYEICGLLAPGCHRDSYCAISKDELIMVFIVAALGGTAYYIEDSISRRPTVSWGNAKPSASSGELGLRRQDAYKGREKR